VKDQIFNLGADEIEIADGPFVIYQGHHGDRGAHRADVILPGAAYTEKSATFVNTEGRAQLTALGVYPPGQAKEDWSILRALSEKVGHALPYIDLAQLRAEMYRAAPALARMNTRTAAPLDGVESLARRSSGSAVGAFELPIDDFYQTNAIARSSKVMAELSALRAQAAPQREAAE
ncbi:MAG: molybdopterin-dependent oxidoreductase, partial [Pseudomonadota bacterium]